MTEKKDTRAYAARSRYQDSEVARDYDHIRFLRNRKRQRKDAATKEAVLEALRRLDGVETVLDLPCGTGRLTRLLIEEGFSYTGSDISAEMIDVARSKLDELGSV